MSSGVQTASRLQCFNLMIAFFIRGSCMDCEHARSPDTVNVPSYFGECSWGMTETCHIHVRLQCLGCLSAQSAEVQRWRALSFQTNAGWGANRATVHRLVSFVSPVTVFLSFPHSYLIRAQADSHIRTNTRVGGWIDAEHYMKVKQSAVLSSWEKCHTHRLNIGCS